MVTTVGPGVGVEVALRYALPGFSLEVAFTAPGSGVTALFGPSGSGKTLLLRSIAGLIRPRPARIVVNGVLWQEEERGYFLPPHRRSVGYVFQEARLFPHLTVEGNLEYAIKRASQPQLVRETVVAWLGLKPLLLRWPTHLSGGERQRVAIARALLTSPRLLLMDEPLAALDKTARAELLDYLERLYQILDIPVLYVSHSQEEVARLADHLINLEKGRIIASESAL